MIYTTEAPDALFRHAMEIPLTAEREGEARAALQETMSKLLARCDLKADPRAANMLLACRLRLRAWQNTLLCARAESEFLARPCELREIVFDLCTASDILLRPTGRTVRFDAPAEMMEVIIAPRDFAWLVLEMICNCALHCQGEEIEVELETKKRREAHAGAITLKAQCGGNLDLEALHAAIGRRGSGVAAMQRTAWLHKGALLWLEREGMSVAALRLPGRARGGAADLHAQEFPDCVELLSDPCSQVYVGLSPVTGACFSPAEPL